MLPATKDVRVARVEFNEWLSTANSRKIVRVLRVPGASRLTVRLDRSSCSFADSSLATSLAFYQTTSAPGLHNHSEL